MCRSVRPFRRPLCLLAALLLAGCSIRTMAVNALADELASSTGGALTQDDDLQLVGEAVPFALKLMEILHESAPEHEGLCEALASGFTQYAIVWAQHPAEQLKYQDFKAYKTGIERSGRLLLRARGYALEGMELRHPGFSQGLEEDTDAALQATTTEDVGLLYWLGASWRAAISNSRENPEMIGQFPTVAAILQRALELDESYDRGALHEIMVSLEPALPLPGGDERALQHYERVLELAGGCKASPHVSLATALYIDKQDRQRFEALLEQALAVDVAACPDDRLANEYARSQARFLLEHLDDLFLDEIP